MRKFSESDKELVNKLRVFLEGDSHSLVQFLQQNFFIHLAVFLFEKDAMLSLYFPVSVCNDKKKKSKCIMEFGNVLSLFRYLIDEDYITFLPYFESEQKKLKIIWFETAENFDILSNGTADLGSGITFDRGKVYKNRELYYEGTNFGEFYFHKFKELCGDAFPTPRLEDLINNDFLSEEECRHQEMKTLSQANLNAANSSVVDSKTAIEQANISIKQAKLSIKYARIAIWVALTIGAVSTAVNIWLARDKTVHIDDAQTKEYIKKQDEVIQRVSSVDEKIKDTINVHVANKIFLKDTLSVKVENRLGKDDTLNVKIVQNKKASSR